jgi:hypothetical protein
MGVLIAGAFDESPVGGRPDLVPVPDEVRVELASVIRVGLPSSWRASRESIEGRRYAEAWVVEDGDLASGAILLDEYEAWVGWHPEPPADEDNPYAEVDHQLNAYEIFCQRHGLTPSRMPRRTPRSWWSEG